MHAEPVDGTEPLKKRQCSSLVHTRAKECFINANRRKRDTWVHIGTGYTVYKCNAIHATNPIWLVKEGDLIRRKINKSITRGLIFRTGAMLVLLEGISLS